MERIRRSRAKPSLETLFFSTPEQKLVRFLCSEPTTGFSPRVLSSRLKGVRGLGGADGIVGTLRTLQGIGLVQFLDNNRVVCARNEHVAVRLLKTFTAVCDLEGLRVQLDPISDRGILFGSRASGHCRTESDYNLFVVSTVPEEVKKIVARYPLGKKIELVVCTPEEFSRLERSDPEMIDRLKRGVQVWGVA